MLCGAGSGATWAAEGRAAVRSLLICNCAPLNSGPLPTSHSPLLLCCSDGASSAETRAKGIWQPWGQASGGQGGRGVPQLLGLTLAPRVGFSGPPEKPCSPSRFDNFLVVSETHSTRRPAQRAPPSSPAQNPRAPESAPWTVSQATLQVGFSVPLLMPWMPGLGMCVLSMQELSWEGCRGPAQNLLEVPLPMHETCNRASTMHLRSLPPHGRFLRRPRRWASQGCWQGERSSAEDRIPAATCGREGIKGPDPWRPCASSSRGSGSLTGSSSCCCCNSR